MKRTRTELHRDAERIVGALVLRYGNKLPEDVQTTVGYYISCRHGFDRAAEHVIGLHGHVKEDL